MLRIKISDYTNYDWRTCFNGGGYAFFTTYREMPDGRFRVEFDTTADFEYCPFCGCFGDSCGCGDMDDPWTYVSKEEALLAYKEAKDRNDEDYIASLYENFWKVDSGIVEAFASATSNYFRKYYDEMVTVDFIVPIGSDKATAKVRWASSDSVADADFDRFVDGIHKAKQLANDFNLLDVRVDYEKRITKDEYTKICDEVYENLPEVNAWFFHTQINGDQYAVEHNHNVAEEEV